MNVDLIYQLQRDEAFADQFSADAYSTFVAMPFSGRFGYPEARVWRLLSQCHNKATALLRKRAQRGPIGRAIRRFEPLRRVDDTTSAVVITDEIIRRILSAHFFVGDLTGCNTNVVIEAGIALALKPNERVLLFSQDDIAYQNFDLKVTKVMSYTEDNLVNGVAESLANAARAFEKEGRSYVTLLSSQITPDAITLLRVYRRLWSDPKRRKSNPALWEDSAASASPTRFKGAVGRIAFHQAARELTQRRLLWSHYDTKRQIYGIHATKLGWRVIELLWPGVAQPHHAPTGPA